MADTRKFVQVGIPWWGRVGVWLFAAMLWAAPVWGIEVETAMLLDPALPTVPEEMVFSPKLKPLWIDALSAEEADVRRQAADALAESHRRGLRGLEEAVPPLAKLLEADDQHPVVRYAAAQALIEIDARTAADVLARRAESLNMAQLIEPALARWNYQPFRQVWLARLDDPATPVRRLTLAIEGLERIGEAAAAPRLAELVEGKLTPPDVRLTAARALGVLQPQGLEGAARRLRGDTSPAGLVPRLAAARLVRHHSGADAEKLLAEIALDPEPTVAAIGLARLLEIDPMLVAPLNAQLRESPDPNVRMLLVRALEGQATPAAVKLLGRLLPDPHPHVRRDAREALIALAAQPSLDELVRGTAMKVLQGKRPHGITQAAMLVAALDHEPAADRLVELLDHEVPEVYVTAAWALRLLAVPATAEPIFARLERQHEASQVVIPYAKVKTVDFEQWKAIYDQADHLIEALGVLEYAPAEPLLRNYLPKPPRLTDDAPAVVDLKTNHQARLRARAIWSLGHIVQGEISDGLAKILIGRLSDADILNPEAAHVRMMSAVTLGRRDYQGAVKSLKRFYPGEASDDALGNACGWALEQLTGEGMAPPQVRKMNQQGWFLEPIEF